MFLELKLGIVLDRGQGHFEGFPLRCAGLEAVAAGHSSFLQQREEEEEQSLSFFLIQKQEALGCVSVL